MNILIGNHIFIPVFCADNYIAAMQSLVNLQSAANRCMMEDQNRHRFLPNVLDMNSNALRERLKKPLEWRFNELAILTTHYKLSNTTVNKAELNLKAFVYWVEKLSVSERNKLLKQCQLSVSVLKQKNISKWKIEKAIRIQNGLKNNNYK